eukprot:m.47219 g.47219  ORF g.47219 m.47219 type:complete len:127 (-) comp6345_c0_seq2:152-532(-)
MRLSLAALMLTSLSAVPSAPLPTSVAKASFDELVEEFTSLMTTKCTVVEQPDQAPDFDTATAQTVVNYVYTGIFQHFVLYDIMRDEEPQVTLTEFTLPLTLPPITLPLSQGLTREELKSQLENSAS